MNKEEIREMAWQNYAFMQWINPNSAAFAEVKKAYFAGWDERPSYNVD